MPRAISIVVLIAGLVLLLWGFNASESVASEVSEVIDNTPSSRSMLLIVVGGVVTAVGAFGLFRRGR
jgi:uncharacterized membrane protein